MSGYVQTAPNPRIIPHTESEGRKNGKSGEGCTHFVRQKSERGERGARTAKWHGRRVTREREPQREPTADLTPLLYPPSHQRDSLESGRITRALMHPADEILSSEGTVCKFTAVIRSNQEYIQKQRHKNTR